MVLFTREQEVILLYCDSTYRVPKKLSFADVPSFAQSRNRYTEQVNVFPLPRREMRPTRGKGEHVDLFSVAIVRNRAQAKPGAL